MKIAILNYSDVRNFGDVLFPVIIRDEIVRRIEGADIEFFNPTGDWWGGIDSRVYNLGDLDGFDAIILGGGEIVHRHDGMLRAIYERFGLGAIDDPTDLVFSWTSLQHPFKAWLSLGMPPADEVVIADTRRALDHLDFASARGSFSAARMRGSNFGKAVAQTPDLGWLFPRLSRRFDSKVPSPNAPYIAVQALKIPNKDEFARDLRIISRRLGLNVVLLPLTRCWDDSRDMGELFNMSNGDFILVDDHTTDIDKLSIIMCSSMYIGQSMHGFISAIASGRPAGICLPETDDKFGELMLDLDLRDLRVDDLSEITELSHRLDKVPLSRLCRIGKRMRGHLDLVFDDLCNRILDHSSVAF